MGVLLNIHGNDLIGFPFENGGEKLLFRNGLLFAQINARNGPRIEKLFPVIDQLLKLFGRTDAMEREEEPLKPGKTTGFVLRNENVQVVEISA